MSAPEGLMVVGPDEGDIDRAVRELASTIGTRNLPELRLRQAEVVSVQAPFTCTCYLDGDRNNPIPGLNYLIDAMAPQPGALYWMLDGGPGIKLLIGTCRNVWSQIHPYNGGIPESHYVDVGRHSRTNNNTNWADNFWNPSTNTPAANLSPAGANTAELRFGHRLSRVTYTVNAWQYMGPNFGNMRITIQGGPDNKFPNEVQIGGDFQGYSASPANMVSAIFGTVTIDTPGTYLVRIKKLGTKHASSTDYFVAFIGICFSVTALNV